VRALAPFLFGALTLSACGDDDGDDTGAGGASGSGGASSSGGTSSLSGGTTSGESGATSAGSPCERGCIDTLAADCQNGPTSLRQCEEDCEMLAAGSCGDVYRAFQACAAGEPIGCDATGRPRVDVCTEEQQSFIDCLG
jgi:hypothetical protein